MSTKRSKQSSRLSQPAARCKIPLGRGPERHGSPGPCPTTAALQQCNDLVLLQNTLLHDSFKHRKEMVGQNMLEREKYEDIRRDLESETVEHARTKGLLNAEQEKAQLALTEVSVLARQLDREKATFEKAFGLLKSQALSDSTKSETLLAKCSALECLVASKDDAIARLEGQVHEQTGRIREMKRAHKMELQEANVRMQQEMYLAKHFKEEEKPSKGRTSASSRGRTTSKLKNS